MTDIPATETTEADPDHGPPCRTSASADRDMHPAVLISVIVAFAVGYWAAVGFTSSVAVSDELDDVQAELDLWLVLLGSVVGFAIASCVVSLARLKDLTDLFVAISKPTIARWACGVFLIIGTLVASLFWANESAATDTINNQLARATRPITVIVAIASIPGLINFLMIRSLSVHPEHWQERAACRIMLVTRLRRELQRTLAMFAVLLTLIVVTTGMRRRMLLAHDDTLSIPIEQVALYGLVFAALLGAMYGIAKVAIDQRSEALVDEFAELPDPAAPQFGETLKRRSELQGVLGLGRGTRQSFESTVAIAAPLVTALVGAALG